MGRKENFSQHGKITMFWIINLKLGMDRNSYLTQSPRDIFYNEQVLHQHHDQRQLLQKG
jgi:hypothetical protein